MKSWRLRLALLTFFPGTLHSLMHVPLHGPRPLRPCAPAVVAGGQSTGQSSGGLCRMSMGRASEAAGGGEAGAHAHQPGLVVKVKRARCRARATLDPVGHTTRPWEGQETRARRPGSIGMAHGTGQRVNGTGLGERTDAQLDAASAGGDMPSLQVARQVAVVTRLIARPPADVGLMSSGEVVPHQLWSAGPRVVLAELLRAILLLAVVVKHAAALTLQVRP
jgi:hypothetical protein